MAEEKAHLGVLDGWRGISILLVLAATFAAAHLSTVYYEQGWIDLGKRLSRRGSVPTGRS